jgi:hypothetical protein
MGSLPPNRAGVGSAVNDTTRQTGGALGVAVLGSVFAARYQHAIGSLPFVPASQRAFARESIGTSLDVARRLPGEAALRLREVADASFLDAMRLTYACGVGVVLIAIFVAWRFLPARSPVRSTIPDERVQALAVGVEDITG